jgi:Ricin-type beta-trefoil lectin domain-like
MNMTSGKIKTGLLTGLLLLFVQGIISQQPQLPKNINQPKQVLIPIRPLIKKDEVKYVPAPVTVTAMTSFATADQLYLATGSYLIRTARDYRYLTVKDDYNKSSIVYQYAPWALSSQFWSLVLQRDGYYKIKSGLGLFLEMGGNSTYYVVSKAEANTNNQLWQLEEADNGNYYIKSKGGQYLGVTMSQVTDGTVAGLSNTRGNSNFQKWQLIKMTDDRRRVTSFNPTVNGFRFTNTFNGEDVIRWGGLCGGMVYTALDYFRTGIPIPRQSWTPANATTLQSYIYQRQQHSMWNVNEKWSELEVAYNLRGGEIFRWGIQGSGGGRLEELKNAIDAGRSVPIGLFVGGVTGFEGSGNGNHVVLAIGYSLGRYTGNFEGHPGDYKILVYNPNLPNQLSTLVPDMEGQRYFEIETGKAWRTYFVNNKYDNDHSPPRDIPNFPEGEPEGRIRHLYVQFLTGGDDLRGQNDNVSITVSYTDGTTQVFPNVNNGARWIDNSTQTIHIELNRPVRKSDIRHFMLTTSFGSDILSDDWNLDGFQVTNGLGGIVFAESFAPPGQYIFRFSGDEQRQRHIVRVQ